MEIAPIKKELEQRKDAKEILCDTLIKVAKTNRTPPWTMRDLNPTPVGVRILWVGGGGLLKPPPKKSMIEWAETPCCYRHIVKV